MNNKRVVNVRYQCCGLNFDAAIDCDWGLHYYGDSVSDKVTPIELYCLDNPDWDIRMIYQEGAKNDQQNGLCAFHHTILNWDFIMKETRKWVREIRKKK